MQRCSYQDAVAIVERIMGDIVSRGYPFSTFDRKGGMDSSETMLLGEFRPRFEKRFLPSSHLLGGKYLDEFSQGTLQKVRFCV